jgi:hypothetical protein
MLYGVAMEWRVVAEVVPNGKSVSRARESAELYLKAPEVTRRNTRVHFIQPLKQHCARSRVWTVARRSVGGPELARIGLSETEAEAQGIAYRLFKVPMETSLRARTLSETRGFVKALVEADSDRILGFTAFGIGAGEVMSAVQIAMIAGLPYTVLRDAVLTHPTLVEGLIPLFSSVASVSNSTGANAALKSGDRALPE